MAVSINISSAGFTSNSDVSSVSIPKKNKSTRGILQCKSERTSPTQRRKIKKNVRFSDCIDLEQAEYAINLRTEANVENYAYQTMMINGGPYSFVTELQLQKYFWLPTERELEWLVGEQCVHLENVRWFGRVITGIVRVKNLGYEKEVVILYTYDDWATSHTVKAAYSESPLPQQDQFSFCIFLPYLKLDLCIYFCIKYECSKMTFWDNNCGKNYKFICHTVANFNGEAKEGETKFVVNNSSFFDSNCSIFF